MTPEQRQQKFLELLEAAQKQTGIRLQVTLNTRSFGNSEMLQIEPVLNLVVDPNWLLATLNDISNNHPDQ
jgi:hypothetical protein